ncbi:SLATT domain-containing protein [Microbulbifer thermotolerans]|uniref:SLATT domain-containing protein n=1 Tax=Microbulbifer thermotolerans TaxID=252514 RepID=UPI0022495349|nr:SLATT domain-containing protein [Microbulbifer thermotolerans]
MKELLSQWLGKPLVCLFSLQPEEKPESDPAKKLLNSMRLTAKCRFNASVRLERLARYSFLTTTIFSLGLIFIPLYQKSGLSMPYTEQVVNMLQIFLAVAVLVYSVVNATAKYDARSATLDACGVKIKELIRKLRYDISESEKSGVSIDLEKYHHEYHVISSEPENHHRVDFIFAVLESKQDFDISGIPRLWQHIKARVFYMLPYVIPTSMMIFEVFIITDILGLTNVFTGVFGSNVQ